MTVRTIVPLLDLRGAIPAYPRRGARRRHSRVRQPAVHPGTRSRGARARARGRAWRRPRHRCLVGNRCAPRRDDGARRRSRRRSHHQHLFVLRDGRVHCRGWARRRGSSTSIRRRTTSSRPPCARALSPRTKAIIPVHLYGLCADMDPLLGVAARRACQSSRTRVRRSARRYKGRQAGAMGAAGCFSFFPSKNLGAFGDGGLVTTERCGAGARNAAAAESRL